MGWKYKDRVEWYTTFDELKPGEYFIYNTKNDVMLKLYEGYYVDGSAKYVRINGYPYWVKRVYPIAVEDDDIIFSEEKPTS
ncbi:MAG: hypothetical protein SVY53_05405 [Chloroflexota bacterium]|nr:hypothetical protein [Chloroflexota bacterium]